MTQALWQVSAVETASGIRERTFSCTEVMTSVVERIRKLNPALNAIVVDLTDRALAEAAAADRALAGGVEPGPLYGVPVTIKVNVDQEGFATTNGLPALANLIAPADAPLVRNLKAAGAIIVGRTNTPEVSMRATTVNPLHGRTFNPWHPEASPGGSSGGAGAAAAAGLGPIHHGNDIGGSLRFPAFANGVSTIKSTPGRVPAFNPSATVERGLVATLTSVQGAIARTVADVRLATRVMAAYDPRDPWWVPAPFDGAPLAKPIRVAVTRNPHGYPIHPGITALIDRAAGHLSDAGYDVVEAEPPTIMEPARGWFTVLLTEMKATLGPTVDEHGSADLRKIFGWYYELGEILDLDRFRIGLAERTRMIRAWSVFLDTHPLVLTPFLMRPTYPWNYDARGLNETKDLFDAAVYSYGINYLALPAGVVPIDLVDGLPAGVQLVGRRFREDTILDAMAAVEQRAGRLVERLWSQLA
ncbi:MAG: amidase [Candidatus Rokuibacteriota bacterium]|nr:MAG: amidase [Candidatus Rokubacteria bacterium]